MPIEDKNSKTINLKVQNVVMSSRVSPVEIILKSTITVQSVVKLENVTEEGNIIKLIEPAWGEIIRNIQADPKMIYEISWRKWEELIAGAYDKRGFDEVILTPRSCDLGRDVIAVKHGWGSVRIIDQVKAHKHSNPVTANDVRALLGVLQADHSATKGVVTTTADFAPKISEDVLIKPFIPFRLELINGKQLIKLLSDLLKS